MKKRSNTKMAAALGTRGASLWWRLALLVQALGLLVVLFAAPDVGSLSNTAPKALAIIGILAMIAASALVLVIVVLKELRAAKVIAIVFVVLAYASGICLIIGVIIWNEEVSQEKAKEDDVYMTMNIEAKTHVIMSSVLTVCGCLCGFTSASFGVVALVRPKYADGGPTEGKATTAPKRTKTNGELTENNQNKVTTKSETSVSFSSFGDSES